MDTALIKDKDLLPPGKSDTHPDNVEVVKAAFDALTSQQQVFTFKLLMARRNVSAQDLNLTDEAIDEKLASLPDYKETVVKHVYHSIDEELAKRVEGLVLNSNLPSDILTQIEQPLIKAVLAKMLETGEDKVVANFVESAEDLWLDNSINAAVQNNCAIGATKVELGTLEFLTSEGMLKKVTLQAVGINSKEASPRVLAIAAGLIKPEVTQPPVEEPVKPDVRQPTEEVSAKSERQEPTISSEEIVDIDVSEPVVKQQPENTESEFYEENDDGFSVGKATMKSKAVTSEELEKPTEVNSSIMVQIDEPEELNSHLDDQVDEVNGVKVEESEHQSLVGTKYSEDTERKLTDKVAVASALVKSPTEFNSTEKSQMGKLNITSRMALGQYPKLTNGRKAIFDCMRTELNDNVRILLSQIFIDAKYAKTTDVNSIISKIEGQLIRLVSTYNNADIKIKGVSKITFEVLFGSTETFKNNIENGTHLLVYPDMFFSDYSKHKYDLGQLVPSNSEQSNLENSKEIQAETSDDVTIEESDKDIQENGPAICEDTELQPTESNTTNDNTSAPIEDTANADLEDFLEKEQSFKRKMTQLRVGSINYSDYKKLSDTEKEVFDSLNTNKSVADRIKFAQTHADESADLLSTSINQYNTDAN